MFSSMAINQLHEQNNAIFFTGDCGVFGITQDLMCWMLAVAEVI